MDSKRMDTKKIVTIGMLGALSAVLMVLEFTVPLAPSFIKMDFSEFPVILGAFMMGPAAGFFIALVKVALNFVLNGTVTMGVGEFSNFLGSICYMLPAVLVYRKLHTKKGAVVALIVGTVTTSVVLIISNMYLVFPVYAKLFHMDMDQILAMGAATNPFVKNWFDMILLSLLPFNLFKYGLTSLLTFLVYKKIKKAIHM